MSTWRCVRIARMETFSELARKIEDPVVLEAADRAAKFYAWLLEKPERIAAWIAATEQTD